MAVTYLVAYDIAADGVRAKVAALLSAYGVRLQRSVFRCQFGAAALEGVMARVVAMIDEETDSLLVVPWCVTCHEGSREYGQVVTEPPPVCWIV